MRTVLGFILCTCCVNIALGTPKRSGWSTKADTDLLHESHQTLPKRQRSLLAATSAEGVKLADVQGEWQLDKLSSTFECKAAQSGQDPDFTLCKFTNLFLWNGDFYFISGESLPEGIARNMKTKAIKSFSDLGVGDTVQALKWSLAGVLFPKVYNSYFQIFGEHGPTLHSILCKHYDRCGYEPTKQLQLVLANTESVKEQDREKPIRNDWTSCLASSPVILKDGPQLSNKLVVIEQAFALWNPECDDRQDKCAPWDFRSKPKGEIMVSWRNRLASCLGFDPAKSAPKDRLNVVVVDRDYWVGRHFLNINDVVHQVRERYPTANVSVLYPEHLSLAEQAKAFNDMSAVIWVTGGCMANLIFLPLNAAAAHCGMREFPDTPYWVTDRWVETLPNKFELRHSITRNPDRVILRSYWITNSPEYQALTDDQKLELWEEKKCPGNKGEPVYEQCYDIWINKGGEFEMEFFFLWEALDAFMPRLVEEQKKLLKAQS